MVKIKSRIRWPTVGSKREDIKVPAETASTSLPGDVDKPLRKMSMQDTPETTTAKNLPPLPKEHAEFLDKLFPARQRSRTLTSRSVPSEQTSGESQKFRLRTNSSTSGKHEPVRGSDHSIFDQVPRSPDSFSRGCFSATLPTRPKGGTGAGPALLRGEEDWPEYAWRMKHTDLLQPQRQTCQCSGCKEASGDMYRNRLGQFFDNKSYYNAPADVVDERVSRGTPMYDRPAAPRRSVASTRPGFYDDPVNHGSYTLGNRMCDPYDAYERPAFACGPRARRVRCRSNDMPDVMESLSEEEIHFDFPGGDSYPWELYDRPTWPPRNLHFGPRHTGRCCCRERSNSESISKLMSDTTPREWHRVKVNRAKTSAGKSRDTVEEESSYVFADGPAVTKDSTAFERGAPLRMHPDESIHLHANIPPSNKRTEQLMSVSPTQEDSGSVEDSKPAGPSDDRSEDRCKETGDDSAELDYKLGSHETSLESKEDNGYAKENKTEKSHQEATERYAGIQNPLKSDNQTKEANGSPKEMKSLPMYVQNQVDLDNKSEETGYDKEIAGAAESLHCCVQSKSAEETEASFSQEPEKHLDFIAAGELRQKHDIQYQRYEGPSCGNSNENLTKTQSIDDKIAADLAKIIPPTPEMRLQSQLELLHMSPPPQCSYMIDHFYMNVTNSETNSPKADYMYGIRQKSWAEDRTLCTNRNKDRSYFEYPFNEIGNKVRDKPPSVYICPKREQYGRNHQKQTLAEPYVMVYTKTWNDEETCHAYLPALNKNGKNFCRAK